MSTEHTASSLHLASVCACRNKCQLGRPFERQLARHSYKLVAFHFLLLCDELQHARLSNSSHPLLARSDTQRDDSHTHTFRRPQWVKAILQRNWTNFMLTSQGRHSKSKIITSFEYDEVQWTETEQSTREFDRKLSRNICCTLCYNNRVGSNLSAQFRSHFFL